jgi:hypothetical protein
LCYPLRRSKRGGRRVEEGGAGKRRPRDRWKGEGRWKGKKV